MPTIFGAVKCNFGSVETAQTIETGRLTITNFLWPEFYCFQRTCHTVLFTKAK
jgi:hypothetical protein